MLTELALNLHLVIDQVQRELVEGYRTIVHLILIATPIILHRPVNALGNEVRTNVVYTTLGEMEACKRLIEAGFRFVEKKPCKWANVGGLTFDHQPKLPEQIPDAQFFSVVC